MPMILYLIRWQQLMVLFIYLLITVGVALVTKPPVWVTSDYFRAGNQDVISSLTGEQVTPTHTFTFSSALSGLPLLGYGMKAYQGSDYFGQERFQINRTDLTASTFTVAVQIIGVTNIWNLNVAYIAIDPEFPHEMNSFDNVPINFQDGDLVNITEQKEVLLSYKNIVNFTDQAGDLQYNQFSSPLSDHKVLLFMTSLYITGILEDHTDPTGFIPLQIKAYGEIVSLSEYSMQATTDSQIAIEKFHFSQIFFNQRDVESSLKYVLIYTKLEVNNIQGEFIPIPEEFVDNFILGLTDFSSKLHSSILDFKWKFSTINGVFGVQVEPAIGVPRTLPNSQFPIDHAGFTMLYIKTWYCPSQASFFDQDTQMCTQCPVANCTTCLSLTECHLCDTENQYYLNQTSYQCAKCQTDENQCFFIDTLQCKVCRDVRPMQKIDDSNQFTFYVEYDGILNITELEAQSFFTDDQFTSFIISETSEEGVYKVIAIYNGDLRKNLSSSFVMPGNMTYAINYITDYQQKPLHIILTPQPEDLSIFIFIGSALAAMACCYCISIYCIRRRQSEKKKKKKREKKLKKKKSIKKSNCIESEKNSSKSEKDSPKSEKDSSRCGKSSQKSKKNSPKSEKDSSRCGKSSQKSKKNSSKSKKKDKISKKGCNLDKSR